MCIAPHAGESGIIIHKTGEYFPGRDSTGKWAPDFRSF